MGLSLLPQYALVGLITYGTMTQVHELGYTECAKSYVFRGSKDYASKQVQEMLGLGQMAPRANVPQQPGRPAVIPQGGARARFILPVSQCELQLNNALEQLQRDPLARCERQAPIEVYGRRFKCRRWTLGDRLP